MRHENSVWSRSPDVAFVDDGERIVVLDLRDPARPPQLLSSAACLVWRMLPGAAEPAAPQSAVRAGDDLGEFEVSSLLEQLEAAGLAVRRC